MPAPHSHRRALRAGVVGLLVFSLTACAARGGPAPLVEEPPAPVTTATTTTPATQQTLGFGIDTMTNGLNPHLIADRGPFVDALASLVLPSAYVSPATAEAAGYIMSPDDLAVGRIRNSDLITAVATSTTATLPETSSTPTPSVTPSATSEPAALPASAETRGNGSAGVDEAPLVVRYTLAEAAQWSDGVPITGADFEYLAQQLVSSSGVVDAANYRTIESISVTGSGREVTVRFVEPNPRWRDLFTYLLPAHLLRDTATSFNAVLAGSVPASAGRYMVRSADLGRGEVELVRNDRYWGTAVAEIERVTFYRTSSDTAAADMLRSNQAQLVDLRPGAVTALTLGGVRDTELLTATHSQQLQLIPNFSSTQMRYLDLRNAIADSIDRTRVAQIASGRPDAQAPGVLVRTTADDPGEDSQDVDDTPLADSPLVSVLRGRNLTIGVQAGDVMATAAAGAVADQLRAQGATVHVRAVGAATLYTESLPTGEIDLLVGWVPTYATTAQTVSNHFACGPDAAVTVSPTTAATPTTTGSADGTAEPASSTEFSPAPEADGAMGGMTSAREQVIDGLGAMALNSPRGGNLAGVCDPDIIEPYVAELAAGQTVDAATEQAVIQRIADTSLVVPLLDDETLLAVSPQLSIARDSDGRPLLDPAASVFPTAFVWQRHTTGY